MLTVFKLPPKRTTKKRQREKQKFLILIRRSIGGTRSFVGRCAEGNDESLDERRVSAEIVEVFGGGDDLDVVSNDLDAAFFELFGER